jgi:hypothetical protein
LAIDYSTDSGIIEVDEGEETMTTETKTRSEEMTTTKITNDATSANGWYVIHMDGCSWVAVLIRRGRMVGLVEASEAETHYAAMDHDAAVCQAVENERTTPVSDSAAEAIVAAYDDGIDHTMCVVERIG